jgi:hypothetical protein
MAGEAARRVARDARAKAERLQRRADLFEQGAAGEDATAAVLQTLLPEWHAIHDVRWPGRRLANVDHVLLGPGGIFVIDSKNWSGRISISDGHLRQNGRSREKSVSSAADAALAISELVGPHAAHVHPVLCFTGEAPLVGWCRDVMVCSTTNLRQLLLTRPHVLGAAEQMDAWFRLDAQLRPAAEESPPPTTSLPSLARPRSGKHRVTGTDTARRMARRQARRKKGGSLTSLILGVLMVVTMLAWGPRVASVVGPALVEQFTGNLGTSDCSQSSVRTGPGRIVEKKEKRRARDGQRRSARLERSQGEAAASSDSSGKASVC